MNLGQVVSLSDTGRKRRHNEDSYVCEPPLFAIADGMGGAQAGEVASELAANALQEHAGEPGAGEKRVVELIQEANRRVFDRANEDSALSGMGTTLTLALAEEGKVSVGHVGDSRAYLLRDGKLDQITEDHSLVAELTRAGKLSEEEAETHPQRSVITRALGTDRDVDVDAFTVETHDGDVFMLCSDGLTSMVEDKAILEILEKRRGNLKRAGQDLVKAANRSGGEDNITVLLFEIGEAAQRTAGAAAPDADEEDDEDTLSGLEAVPVIEARPDEWAAVDGDVPEATIDHPPERARRSRRLYWIAAAVILLAVVGLGLFGLSQSHFVGAQRDGHVAVYQGLPYDIAGVHLYRTVYVSRVLAGQLTQTERKRLFDHDLRGFGSARDAIRRYEEEIPP
ncbi:MAG: Stp1/IreP family PP2C-type Ser/Thr phosphatase [Actinobacteria bacterium]|nr:Stp1/IreP family PP2C-type Ser/Thr phosphatase [Actinomycetota bacterium]